MSGRLSATRLVHQPSRRWGVGLVTAGLAVAACTSPPEIGVTAGGSPAPSAVAASIDTSEAELADSSAGSTTSTSTSEPPPLAGGVDPATLETAVDGAVLVQPTPPELRDRQLATINTLPAPTSETFTFTIDVLAGEPLERSTWKEDCPVEPADLRYVTVSFWGFDGEVHTGELIVAADQADNMVGVFRTLFGDRFPIEEMRIVTDADLEAKPTGDSNNTASYVCRAVTGGSRFSEHAYGLAIDVNPFHNPYVREDVIIPELASSYLDRGTQLTGMIQRDDIVVWAFAEVGWAWGGDWQSLKDYQHFALNNR